MFRKTRIRYSLVNLAALSLLGCMNQKDSEKEVIPPAPETRPQTLPTPQVEIPESNTEADFDLVVDLKINNKDNLDIKPDGTIEVDFELSDPDTFDQVDVMCKFGTTDEIESISFTSCTSGTTFSTEGLLIGESYTLVAKATNMETGQSGEQDRVDFTVPFQPDDLIRVNEQEVSEPTTGTINGRVASSHDQVHVQCFLNQVIIQTCVSGEFKIDLDTLEGPQALTIVALHKKTHKELSRKVIQLCGGKECHQEEAPSDPDGKHNGDTTSDDPGEPGDPLDEDPQAPDAPIEPPPFGVSPNFLGQRIILGEIYEVTIPPGFYLQSYSNNAGVEGLMVIDIMNRRVDHNPIAGDLDCFQHSIFSEGNYEYCLTWQTQEEFKVNSNFEKSLNHVKFAKELSNPTYEKFWFNNLGRDPEFIQSSKFIELCPNYSKEVYVRDMINNPFVTYNARDYSYMPGTDNFEAVHYCANGQVIPEGGAWVAAILVRTETQFGEDILEILYVARDKGEAWDEAIGRPQIPLNLRDRMRQILTQHATYYTKF